MRNQGVVKATLPDAASLVGWMGCVQAQDFAQAKWGLGLRTGAPEARIEEDFNAGRILRTHVLRPTWHFILPQDIGWMLRLSAPRIKAFSKPMHRQLDIDTAVLRRSKKVIEKSLAGGKALTRTELATIFKRARINTDDIRMNFLMMDAELDGIICSGPRKGKQFTYVLLTEGVSQVLDLDGDAALGELARRYFTSRGPATLQDFAWWGGVNLGQAKRGFEVVKEMLECVVVNGQAYWFARALVDTAGLALPGSGTLADTASLALPRSGALPPVILLPAFDELTVAYKDRSDILPREYEKESSYGLKPVVVVNGRIVGIWRRVLGKGKVIVEVRLFEKVSKTAERLIGREVKRYGKFVEEGVVEIRKLC
ncbi:MAG TPA: winged helix DNA-binding domain-containing protein [Puia sp.]|nr:winged helix DNA-binding domain-containing protein [Puia sp.]